MNKQIEQIKAVIERLKADALQKKNQCKRSGLERIMHQIGAYNKILSFLDTLETKEVQEEPVSEDLEKAAEEWDGSLYRSDAFKAGAKWKEEQMIKDAIDTELDDVCGFLTISVPYHNGIAGDKVKVIIIKEE